VASHAAHVKTAKTAKTLLSTAGGENGAQFWTWRESDAMTERLRLAAGMREFGPADINQPRMAGIIGA
jgi:hypothetical protein